MKQFLVLLALVLASTAMAAEFREEVNGEYLCVETVYTYFVDQGKGTEPIHVDDLRFIPPLFKVISKDFVDDSCYIRIVWQTKNNVIVVALDGKIEDNIIRLYLDPFEQKGDGVYDVMYKVDNNTWFTIHTPNEYSSFDDITEWITFMKIEFLGHCKDE